MPEQIRAALVGGHPHHEFATARMAHQKQPGAAWSLPEDAIHRPVSEVDSLLGLGHRLRIGRRAAVAGPVERHHGESGCRAGPYQGQRRVARAVEIRSRWCLRREWPRLRPWGLRLRRPAPTSARRRRSPPLGGRGRTGHAPLLLIVRLQSPAAGSKSTPLGVRPPLLTTPTRASAT